MNRANRRQVLECPPSAVLLRRTGAGRAQRRRRFGWAWRACDELARPNPKRCRALLATALQDAFALTGGTWSQCVTKVGVEALLSMPMENLFEIIYEDAELLVID